MLDSHETTCFDHSLPCRKKFSAVKQEGGGCWLLGFARLHKRNSISSEQPDDDMTPPELVRLPSCSSLELDGSIEDEPVDALPPKTKSKGVSFDEVLKVQPIPHCSTLSPLQKHMMYTSNFELYLNKHRNKKEYRYEGCNWRNAAEEWKMHVDAFTGELIHPAHNHL